MKRKIELLAPGGDLDSIKAAIIAGADAIYCGLDRFNARNRAENITLEDLNGILRLAHSHDCEVFLTLNIIIVESEIPALLVLLNKLINTKIDGVIVQDLGICYLLAKYFPGLKIHASTQMTSHNEGQIKFLSKLGATRVNLSRELNLSEIKTLTSTSHENNFLTEVFVHGSYCLSFSGICYLSSVHSGNSGNRGRCSQPCRDQYLTTAAGNDFPLNLKDNSAYFDLEELSMAGVDSIKIEGRIKKFHYVYTVVDAFRKQLQSLYSNDKLNNDNSDLHKVFNRDFSNSFLHGDLTNDMFIDNPRDNSASHLAKTFGGATYENIKKAKRELYDLKTDIIKSVRSRIEKLSIEKAPLTITISGKSGAPLKVAIKTPENSFTLASKINLVKIGTFPASNDLAKKNKNSTAQGLNYQVLLTRFKAINETEYFIKDLNLANLQNDLFIPFKELTALKKQILFTLNGAKETIEPITLPKFKKKPKVVIKPTLSLLISSQDDLSLLNATEAAIYFQLPNGLKNEYSSLTNLFLRHNNITPWFPSILIGEDYRAALNFLQQVKPELIVTNNSGIAYEAYQRGIPWIAGPFLNIVNSYSLLCLKENFNCSGAFISNELNKHQIRGIKKPDNFSLYYSIYHPIVLLTSRQCLFHQVSGCTKNKLDATCISHCEKSASITNLKENTLYIEKTKGNYHTIYNDTNFLNTDIVTDVQDLFASFFIDLSEIKTETKIGLAKGQIVALFENHLHGDSKSLAEIQQNIHPSTERQYIKGI